MGVKNLLSSTGVRCTHLNCCSQFCDCEIRAELWGMIAFITSMWMNAITLLKPDQTNTLVGTWLVYVSNRLHCATGTSRSLWTSCWASYQRLFSCRVCLATLFCWFSTSGRRMMPTPRRTLPACLSTLSTCVFSTTTTQLINPSTVDRCSLLHSPLCSLAHATNNGHINLYVACLSEF